MPLPTERTLEPGYTSEVDRIRDTTWSEMLHQFVDANIYQTWPYAEVLSGKGNVSHLVVYKEGRLAALAQVRIRRLPLIPAGVAYVFWGPVWRRTAQAPDESTFRQAIRALRNEFVCKRGLTLRLSPLLFDTDTPDFSTILNEEGFQSAPFGRRSRTLLMNLTPPLEDIHAGMMPHWKRELKIAERNSLEIVEGTGIDLFDAFIPIYREMVSRKRFVEPNDIAQFRKIQIGLPEQDKMRVLLCRSGESIHSGIICSVLGQRAVYLFGATGTVGMKSRGSYALQWRFLQYLKQRRISLYDLNGVNPTDNPGTYKFKSDLAGRNSVDVHSLGAFDSPGTNLSILCLRGGEIVRSRHRSLRKLITATRVRTQWLTSVRESSSK